ncbi:MAG: transglycosylase SLT domain-containing protein [Chitinispirillia bacterium]|nr:transglycosylase SLT domain-containing protein [Chitinispirillia bacterium]
MDFYIERLDKKGESPILLAVGTVSLGRHSRNTIAFSSEDKCVSGYHALIYVSSDKLLLQDMQSTNGTFVNGSKIQDERTVKEGDEIGLGISGPRFRVIRRSAAENNSTGIDRPKHNDNVAAQKPVNDNRPITSTTTIKTTGSNNSPAAQTITAKKSAVSKHIITGSIAALMLIALIFVISFTSGNTGKTKPASSQPSTSPRFNFTPGESSSNNIDYDFDDIGRADVSSGRSVVEARIDAILRRFGERDYQIPPEMVARVEFYIARETGPRRRTVAMFMERRKQYFPMIQRIFTEKNIPLDLAYVSIVESGLDPYALSHAGAKGIWQFMPRTARAYGLEVSAHRDDRTDPEKSTYAAAAYFRHLIAIFGSRSSVMLCMAAYNAGETRIINALKRIEDPMNNRDFWYLYRRKWLAEETNEYIPQILALIIISEHMEEYGFE